jgi:glycyl-tRNA synthetase
MKKEKNSDNLMEKIVSLCKRRGFIFPGSEIYGGLANSWDFGSVGTEIKNNLKHHWWKTFVQDRDEIVGLDAAIIMNPKTWESSGHLMEFTDPLVECKKCHNRFRADQIEGFTEHLEYRRKKIESAPKVILKCPHCDTIGSLNDPKMFNLMFKTFIGPAEREANIAYLRPETAQGIFVNFNNILDTTHKKLPFGVAQIGKAFRNEITPGNFIFRTREFEQMEIEYFFNPEKNKWEEKFDMWLEAFKIWMEEIGIDSRKLFFHDISQDELAHYSRKTIDVEFDFPFGRKELFGLAYRTDFDLKSHKLKYRDPETQEESIPHVIEPSLGVERMLLAIIISSYTEEEVEGETRVVLKFKKSLAPIKVAVFPLLKNKPELVKKAKEVYDSLKSQFMCEFDDNGNIGKRYRRQDEIGTPYCVTVDFDTLEKGDLTVRDRDTMKQERVKIEELESYLRENLNL